MLLSIAWVLMIALVYKYSMLSLMTHAILIALMIALVLINTNAIINDSIIFKYSMGVNAHSII